MSYGTIKVDTITFTDNSVDKSVSLSGLIQNPTFTGNITVTGTISGDVIRGGTTVSGATVTGTTANFVSGVFTTQISGATVTGTTVLATTGAFTSLTGTTTQGTTATYTTGSFTSLTGTTIQGTTATYTTGSFTSLTGTTIQGTTATYTTGSFTSLTGTTVTGTTASFTSGVFTNISGTTATITSGIIASGTAAAPSLAILADLDTGLFSPGANELAVATNGTARLYIASDGKVGVGTTTPGANLQIGDGSSATLGSTAPYAWVSARALSSAGAATTPQELLRLSWQEGDQNLGEGEGCAINFAASLLADSGTFYPVASIASFKETDDDSLRTSALTFSTSADGSASPTERLRIKSDGESYFQANNTTSAVTINQIGTGNALVVEDTTNPDASPFVIDENGRTVQGHTVALSLNGSGGTPICQLNGNSTVLAAACYSAVSWSDAIAAPGIFLAKARADAVDTYTIVPNSQKLGELRFAGADGVEFQNAARINVEVDAAPSLGIVPGRIVFDTANSSGTLTEAMRITSAGNVGINTATPATTLDVNGDVTITDKIIHAGDPNTAIRFPAADTVSVETNGVERVRVNSDGVTLFAGRVAFPGTSALTSLSEAKSIFLHSNSGTTTGSVAFESQATLTSTRYHAVYGNGNGIVGSISTNGSATSYNTSSDYRLKENVVLLTGAIDRLQQIPVHRFNFIADPDTVVDGFIAHEAQEIVPECVTGTKDEVDENGNPAYQGIDQSKLVPLLTAALQEAVAKIESLEARLTAAGI
jgi:hypothetical protein